MDINDTPDPTKAAGALLGAVSGFAAAATTLAVLYGASVGIFVGQILNIIGAPFWAAALVGVLVTLWVAKRTTGLFGLIVGTGLVEAFSGSITLKAFGRSAIVTAFSAVWSLLVVHWLRLHWFPATYVVVAWSAVIFMIACMLFSGVNLLTTVFNTVFNKVREAQNMQAAGAGPIIDVTATGPADGDTGSAPPPALPAPEEEKK